MTFSAAPSIQEQMRGALISAFTPVHLEITDDSHRHAGHAGSRPEGETHFRVVLVSKDFAGESRVARQRKVYAILQQLLATRIHALQLMLFTPEEYAARQ